LELLVLATALAIVAIVVVVVAVAAAIFIVVIVVIVVAVAAAIFIVAVDVQILQVALETAANVIFVIPILINVDTLDIAVTIVMDLDYSLVHAAIAAPVAVVVAGVFEFAYL
jgi:hypothetical protein